MDAIVDSTYDINEGQLDDYKTNYSGFLKEARERFETQHAAWKNQEKEIKEIQDFIDRFRSVTSKAAQVQSRIKQLEKVERVPKPRPPCKVFRIQFPQPERSGQRVIYLEDVQLSYGPVKV